MDFMLYMCADGRLLLRQSDFSAYDAEMLLSNKSLCHFAVVFSLIRHLNETKSACPKTLCKDQERVKNVASSCDLLSHT